MRQHWEHRPQLRPIASATEATQESTVGRAPRVRLEHTRIAQGRDPATHASRASTVAHRPQLA